MVKYLKGSIDISENPLFNILCFHLVQNIEIWVILYKDENNIGDKNVNKRNF